VLGPEIQAAVNRQLNATHSEELLWKAGPEDTFWPVCYMLPVTAGIFNAEMFLPGISCQSKRAAFRLPGRGKATLLPGRQSSHSDRSSGRLFWTGLSKNTQNINTQMGSDTSTEGCSIHTLTST